MATVTVSSLATTTQAGLLSPDSIFNPAEMDLEVSRLFVRLLKEGYSVRSRAKGESMVPLIHRGDQLTVRPGTYTDIRVGDVVVYGSAKDEAEHTLATHRVIGVVRLGPRPYLLTRDDANGWVGEGERVFPEQVYGKVVAVEGAGPTLHLDRPLVALVAWGRIKLVRGIAAGKELVRCILPNRFWTRLQGAARRGFLYGRTPLAPRSDVPVSPASVQTRQPSGPAASAGALPCDPYRALALDLQLEPHPDVLVERLGDQVLLIPATDRLVDMDAVYALNATGAEVWDMLSERRSVGGLIDDPAARHALTSSNTVQDLHTFLANLISIGMVRPVGSSIPLASMNSLCG